jgi:hypothetical protein
LSREISKTGMENRHGKDDERKRKKIGGKGGKHKEM